MTRWFLVCSGILFGCAVILTVFHLSAFDRAWYGRQFEKFGVYRSVPVAEARARLDNVFLYFTNRSELKHEYTGRELRHLEDIRGLVGTVRLAWITLLVAVGAAYLVLRRRRVRTPVIILWWSATALGIAVLAAAAFIAWFEPAYEYLHLALFNNQDWMLDPSREILIHLFPPPLMQQLIVRIVSWSAAIFGACGLAAAASFRKPSPRV